MAPGGEVGEDVGTGGVGTGTVAFDGQEELTREAERCTRAPSAAPQADNRTAATASFATDSDSGCGAEGGQFFIVAGGGGHEVCKLQVQNFESDSKWTPPGG